MPQKLIEFSKYMLRIQKRLQDKGNSEKTVESILRTLRKFCGEKFSSLKAIRNADDLEKRICAESDSTNTRATWVSHCYVVLKEFPYKTDPDASKHYELFKKYKGTVRAEVESGVKTAKQEKNMIPTDDLLKKLEEAYIKVATMPLAPTRSEFQYCLGVALLALYTLIPPRRNSDFLNLWICQTLPETQNPDRNYYAFNTKTLSFNNYKTKATYGNQTFQVPEKLGSILNSVILKHPHLTLEPEGFKFLIKLNQEAMDDGGSLQRLLKKVGAPTTSTAIRHSFLSEKFPDLPEKEKVRKEVATAMAHSISMQTDYVRSL